MYCLKCRKQTKTLKQFLSTAKNGAALKKGVCAICGRTKSQFVKKKHQ